MGLRGAVTILAVCFCAGAVAACSSRENTARSATPTVTPAPARLRPYVAYLNEGDLWAVRSDGSERRVLAAAPEGETIQDFVWAMDGSRIYFAIGLQINEVVLETGNVARAGEAPDQPGAAIDRLEMGRDGNTIIIHALDANSVERLFATSIGQRGSRELTIDEYNALAEQRLPVIKNVGEMSVSPDGRRVLFKDLMG